jgi:hypothetical protein
MIDNYSPGKIASGAHHYETCLGACPTNYYVSPPVTTGDDYLDLGHGY